jgi:hypothetical protein
MIGTELTSDSKPQVAAIAMFLIAAILVVIGVIQQNGNWALGGMMPLAIALALWTSKPHSFAAKLTEQGIVVRPTSELIRYEAIRAVCPTNSNQRQRDNGVHFEFLLQHSGGTLIVPASLNVSSEDVFQFLTGKLIKRREVPTAPALVQYFERQTSTFGDDHVWTFVARRNAAPRGRGWYRSSIVMVGVAAVGLVWVIAGGAMRSDGWTGVGVMSLVLGIIFALLFFVAGKGASAAVGKMRNASLVISPVGFALAQGDLCGELRWAEVRNVRYRGKTGAVFNSSATPGRGIAVHVDGADIIIADVYDAPIQAIHERIEQLWRNGD